MSSTGGTGTEKATDYFSYPGTDPLTPARFPELVFGIVAPAGVAKDRVSSCLRHELRQYGYHVENIKLSTLIRLVPGYENVADAAKDEVVRISSLMDAGNAVRETSQLGDALAILAISEIASRRASLNWNEGKSHPQVESLELLGRERTAYVLDSLKTPDEIATLRATYGQAFILISVYSNRERRIESLSDTIAKSRKDPSAFQAARSDAETLLRRDERDEQTPLGQNVEACFPKGDLFVDLDSSTRRYDYEIDRFLQIVFNNPFITPNRDEAGMFHAEAASWRSADLARQVGAAICTPGGDVLALGCNEVPRAFGGLYWEGDTDDQRDFQLQTDMGSEHKRLMVAQLIRRMSEHPSFSADTAPIFDELVEKASKGHNDPTLNGIMALDVIEYGRTVHAEMAALSDAARRGVSIDGATIYVNTFPCHLCARHIVAAGIHRVVYIEPYPKSLTGRLFSDSVHLGHADEASNKVAFEAFSGVAPRFYRFAFQVAQKRKNSIGWTKRDSTTKLKRFVTSYIAIENEVISELLPKIGTTPEGEDHEQEE